MHLNQTSSSAASTDIIVAANFSIDFDMKYVQEKGLAQPIVFRSPAGLGMRCVYVICLCISAFVRLGEGSKAS